MHSGQKQAQSSARGSFDWIYSLQVSQYKLNQPHTQGNNHISNIAITYQGMNLLSLLDYVIASVGAQQYKNALESRGKLMNRGCLL